jgi:hypothetical protein
MNRRTVSLVIVATLVAGAAVGFASYNLGVAHGLAASGAAVAQAPAPGAPASPPYAWGYYRPHPFGFVPPFLGLLFAFLIVRLLFWGGPFRHRWYGYPAQYGPAGLEDWHRHQHERVKTDASGDRA